MIQKKVTTLAVIATALACVNASVAAKVRGNARGVQRNKAALAKSMVRDLKSGSDGKGPKTSTGSPLTCGESQLKFRLSLTTDYYAYETSWSIADSNGNIIESTPLGSLSKNKFYLYEQCFDRGQCYLFKLSDSFGDGLAFGKGGYSIAVDNTTIARDESFGDYYATSLFGNCMEVSPSEAECRRSRYTLNEEKLTWAEHELKAKSLGCHLSSIHNSQENEMVYNAASTLKTPFYIGGVSEPRTNEPEYEIEPRHFGDDYAGYGYDDDDDAATDRHSVWKWSDGTEWDYDHWHSGEPNDPDETFVEMAPAWLSDEDDQSQWNDVYGNAKLPGVYKCCN